MTRLFQAYGSLYASSVRPATEAESDGKWDYIVTVSRLSHPYGVKQNKVSGGRAVADSMADSLYHDLANEVQP